MSNLFIAVATGQNVANIPPIFECGKPGDAILWILSPDAKKGNYHEGASNILQKRSFKILKPVEVENINSPQNIILHSTEIKEHCKNYEHVFIVLNGGQKLTPIPLLAMFRGKNAISANTTLLYGQHKPAELWKINPENLQITHTPYDRNKSLKLKEFIEVNGYDPIDENEALLFWSYAKHNNLSQEIKNSQNNYNYPKNFDEINQLHRKHFEAARVPEGKFPRPSFDSWQKAPNNELFKQWEQTALILLNDQKKLFCPNHFKNLYAISIDLFGIKSLIDGYSYEDYDRFFKPLAEKASKTFNLFGEEAALRCLYKGIGDKLENKIKENIFRKLGIQAPNSNLGFAFESAVRERVQKWLEINKEKIPVTEAWSNLIINKNGLAIGEIDIGLLLSNAILIHLECKAANIDVKDIDARIANLHDTFSMLAELYLVTPAYTQAADEPWFKYLEKTIWPKFEKSAKVKLLKFTLLNQPTSYETEVPSEKNEVPPTKILIDVKSFEENLSQIMAPYLTPADKKSKEKHSLSS